MPSKGRFWLTQDSYSTVIAATPAQVYEMIADLPRMGEWSPECVRVEWTNGATGPAEGATFVGHNLGGPFKRFRWSRLGRVLSAEPGREFSFVTEEGGREGVVWSYRFEAVDGGTRVTESYDVQKIPVWARIIDVPANRHRELREGMQHTLEHLKVVAEGVASARPASQP